MKLSEMTLLDLVPCYLVGNEEAINEVTRRLRNKRYSAEEAQGIFELTEVEISKPNKEGNKWALVLRALCYCEGVGGEVDHVNAIQLLTREIALGNTTAMIDRAWMHAGGRGGPVDYEAAIKLYERAIELGNVRAVASRAVMHAKGWGGPVDYEAAIKLYERAIELGNATAMVGRAWLHAEGQGGPVNYPAAIDLFERAIELGNAAAMGSRAWLHAKGWGGPVNYPAAIKLYERAIELGYVPAMVNCAWLRAKGRGGPVDYEASIKLCERAIGLGSATAMLNRAVMHVEGWGGPVNYPAAIDLFERAIKLGDAHAMASRALMHQKGLGGTVDYKNAARLYRQSLKHDSQLSQAEKSLKRLCETVPIPEVRYHAAMVQSTSQVPSEALIKLFNGSPEEAIGLLIEDDLLSLPEKVDYLEKLQRNSRVSDAIDAHPESKEKFLGGYYFNKANQVLAAKQIEGVEEAKKLLEKVPPWSVFYRNAQATLADIVYSYYHGQVNNPCYAFVVALPYHRAVLAFDREKKKAALAKAQSGLRRKQLFQYIQLLQQAQDTESVSPDDLMKLHERFGKGERLSKKGCPNALGHLLIYWERFAQAQKVCEIVRGKLIQLKPVLGSIDSALIEQAWETASPLVVLKIYYHLLNVLCDRVYPSGLLARFGRWLFKGEKVAQAEKVYVDLLNVGCAATPAATSSASS